MGALKSGAFPVELNGKEYGLLFSLNALDEVQEKFGGYDKLSEVFNKDNPNLLKIQGGYLRCLLTRHF